MSIIQHRTVDHPEANGRSPQPGEQQWTLSLPLENQMDYLELSIGERCRESLRRMLIQEETDDRWITHDKIRRELHDGDIWWHDTGEQIYPVNLMWCPTGEYFFAPAGQWGWGRSQPVSEMGGRWMPCVEPEPDTSFRSTWDDLQR